MSIVTEAQLKALREVGRVVREVLGAMRERVSPGITTRELDAVAFEVLSSLGAQSAPRLFYRFPGHACISVNEEVVHGIPGERVIQPGDTVKLDVVAEKDGFIADAAITVPVPPISTETERLLSCAKAAFDRAIEVAKAGNRVNEIGMAIEDEVHNHGFSVIRELTGHGVGRAIHEKPVIPNYFDPRFKDTLREGLVVAIEPIISAGIGSAAETGDGWTIRTADGRAAVHYEHTLVITNDEPILLTAA